MKNKDNKNTKKQKISIDQLRYRDATHATKPVKETAKAKKPSPEKEYYLAETKKDLELVAKLLKAQAKGDTTYFPPLKRKDK